MADMNFKNTITHLYNLLLEDVEDGTDKDRVREIGKLEVIVNKRAYVNALLHYLTGDNLTYRNNDWAENVSDLLISNSKGDTVRKPSIILISDSFNVLYRVWVQELKKHGFNCGPSVVYNTKTSTVYKATVNIPKKFKDIVDIFYTYFINADNVEFKTFSLFNHDGYIEVVYSIEIFKGSENDYSWASKIMDKLDTDIFGDYPIVGRGPMYKFLESDEGKMCYKDLKRRLTIYEEG